MPSDFALIRTSLRCITTCKQSQRPHAAPPENVRNRRQSAVSFSLGPAHAMRSFASVLAIVCFAQTSFTAEVRFDDLMRNPSRFHQQQVTVTGLAEVGYTIELWRDVRARHRVDLKRVITVVQRVDEARRGSVIAPHSEANLYWVKVTGIVDTHLHGRVGDEPFQLLLEHLEILPGPRERQFLPVLGYFRNDTSITVRLTAYRPSGKYAETGAGPGGITEIAIHKGKVVVSRLSGKPLAQCELTSPRGAGSYYDPQRKAYYFRITNTGIQPVLPQGARGWNLGYTGDRD